MTDTELLDLLRDVLKPIKSLSRHAAMQTDPSDPHNDAQWIEVDRAAGYAAQDVAPRIESAIADLERRVNPPPDPILSRLRKAMRRERPTE